MSVLGSTDSHLKISLLFLSAKSPIDGISNNFISVIFPLQMINTWPNLHLCNSTKNNFWKWFENNNHVWCFPGMQQSTYNFYTSTCIYAGQILGFAYNQLKTWSPGGCCRPLNTRTFWVEVRTPDLDQTIFPLCLLHIFATIKLFALGLQVCLANSLTQLPALSLTSSHRSPQL